METVMARICREAGAIVRTDVMVRDGRRLEIIADGLPLWRGAQLAVDTTLVSPIKADGTARRHAARRNGIALEAARKTKERKYPELAVRGGRARLVVVGAEVGGRFSSDSRTAVRLAVALAVRWPMLQPLANCSSFPISGICGRARRWNAANHGGFVGLSLVIVSRPPWHTIWHPCP